MRSCLPRCKTSPARVGGRYLILGAILGQQPIPAHHRAEVTVGTLSLRLLTCALAYARTSNAEAFTVLLSSSAGAFLLGTLVSPASTGVLRSGDHLAILVEDAAHLIGGYEGERRGQLINAFFILRSFSVHRTKGPRQRAGLGADSQSRQQT